MANKEEVDPLVYILHPSDYEALINEPSPDEWKDVEYYLPQPVDLTIGEIGTMRGFRFHKVKK